MMGPGDFFVPNIFYCDLPLSLYGPPRVSHSALQFVIRAHTGLQTLCLGVCNSFMVQFYFFWLLVPTSALFKLSVILYIKLDSNKKYSYFVEKSIRESLVDVTFR